MEPLPRIVRAIAQCDIDGAVALEVDQCLIRRDPEAYLRMPVLKTMEPRRQPFRRERGHDADRERARFLGPPLARQPLEAVLETGKQFLHVARKDLARRGETQRPVQALEQAGAEMGLEPPDLMADRGGREAKLLGCRLKAAEACRSLEVAKRRPGKSRDMLELGHASQMK